jgi:15-cis-phytoene synthase
VQEPERRKTVRREAKAGDPDRYLSALFAPKSARDDLFALYAFNAELARIPEQVSEPTLGEIKLQWWRDALVVAASGEPTGHPVADALGAALRRRKLGPETLDPLIDARRFDVLERIMPDTLSLMRYLDETAGALFALAAAFLGAAAKPTEKAAKQAGRSYGLTGLMRALAFHASQQRLYLPASDIPDGAAERLLQGETDPAVLGLLTGMRHEARTALAEARPAIRALPAPAQAAFQPLALVEPYLDALERAEPLAPRPTINPVYRLWRLATWRP